uniref:Helicase-associated domain-containing protein n=1 Tax=Pseudo-nitzschia australis TaxID=44445 RepID=A0A6U9XSY0_9STRA
MHYRILLSESRKRVSRATSSDPEDDNSDSNSDISCTATDNSIGLRNHPFWNSQYHSDMLGMDSINDCSNDGGDNDEICDIHNNNNNNDIGVSSSRDSGQTASTVVDSVSSVTIKYLKTIHDDVNNNNNKKSNVDYAIAASISRSIAQATDAAANAHARSDGKEVKSKKRKLRRLLPMKKQQVCEQPLLPAQTQNEQVHERPLVVPAQTQTQSKQVHERPQPLSSLTQNIKQADVRLLPMQKKIQKSLTMQQVKVSEEHQDAASSLLLMTQQSQQEEDANSHLQMMMQQQHKQQRKAANSFIEQQQQQQKAPHSFIEQHQHHQHQPQQQQQQKAPKLLIESLEIKKNQQQQHHKGQQWMASAQLRKEGNVLSLKEVAHTMIKQRVTEKAKNLTNSDELRWEYRVQQVKEFVQEHGHGRVPTRYPVNKELANWCKRQRYHYKVYLKNLQEFALNGKDGKKIKCHMTQERAKALNDVGFCWDLQAGGWEHSYQQLKKCKTLPNKHTNYELWKWMGTQRYQMSLLKRGKTTYLNPDRIQKLNDIGFEWSDKDLSSD